MTTSDEREDLLARAREGEGAAIAAVVDGLRPRIARLAAYYASRCPEEPGDLEQEAWIAILEAIPQVSLGVGDPRQYLIRAGKWRMLNFINQQATRRHEELPEECDQPVASRASAQAAAGQLLEQIFQRLSDRQAVILRALLAGHTCAETARLLGCSTANIAWHTRKIREVYIGLTGPPPPRGQGSPPG
jgi:RNA polymerase sigma factor (sigma-70 family)